LPTLEDAVERVRNGDTAAFQQLVDATSGKLVRLSARMLGNLADAEDVVQDAYVRAYRSITAGEFDRRSKVETWLYRIVVNATIDAKRRAARERKRTGEESADPSWDGAASAEARMALAEIADWMRDLPEEQHTVLVLKSVEGLASTEIADILGITEGAVEQRLVRARATLREKRKKQ
jgi:RNA polymerase sigma-70 factor (ECF subfamily)